MQKKYIYTCVCVCLCVTCSVLIAPQTQNKAGVWRLPFHRSLRILRKQGRVPHPLVVGKTSKDEWTSHPIPKSLSAPAHRRKEKKMDDNIKKARSQYSGMRANLFTFVNPGFLLESLFDKWSHHCAWAGTEVPFQSWSARQFEESRGANKPVRWGRLCIPQYAIPYCLFCPSRLFWSNVFQLLLKKHGPLVSFSCHTLKL